MTLKEITDEFERERIEYIYEKFKSAFPEVRFDERAALLGIGEQGKHLLCYFLRNSKGFLLIKFKQKRKVSIQTDLAEIDSLIQETVKLFQENEFIIGKKEIKEESRREEDPFLDETDDRDGYPKSLGYKARRSTVLRAKKSARAIKYLESVGYDETCFRKNTVGRAICLEKKLPKQTAVRFSQSVDELEQTYLQKKDEFEPLVLATYEFLEKIIHQTHGREPSKETALLALNADGKYPTLQSVGEVCQITREAVRQRLNKELRRVKFSINTYSEAGIERWLARNEYLTLFSGYCVDSFMLYLKENGKTRLLNGFVDGILFEENCPEGWEQRLLEVQRRLKEKEKRNQKNAYQPQKREQGILLRVNEYGEVLTDLVLLEALRAKRKRMADALGVPLYVICKNDKLAIIEEKKPTCEEEYLACGFSQKSWEWFGCEMVKTVKEYLEKI